MVDFVIAELNLDAASAREIKLNPEKFFINYETFKVLNFK
jgi:hypothetical protein